MHRLVLLLVATLLVASSSLIQAQDRPAGPSSGNPSSTTPAVSSPNTTNPQAPVPGANSFTEGQAKSRIESKGYTQATGLQKDDQGIWRGKAMKDGKSVEVSVDFQGNVVER